MTDTSDSHSNGASSGEAARGRIYKGQTREERDLVRRRRVLDTALELYAREGYANVPIERLCAEARVGLRHYYDDFGGREAVLAALFEELVASTRAQVLAAIAEAPDDPLEQIERGLAAFVRAYTDDPRRGRVLSFEVVGVSPTLERRRQEVLREFAMMIHAQAQVMIDRGSLAPPEHDLTMLSLGLAGATHELIMDWLARSDRPPIQPVISTVVFLFNRTLVTPVRAAPSVSRRGKRGAARAGRR